MPLGEPDPLSAKIVGQLRADLAKVAHCFLNHRYPTSPMSSQPTSGVSDQLNNIPHRRKNVENEDISAIDAIKDHVVSNGKGAQICSQIRTGTTEKRILAKNAKPLRDRSNLPVGTLRTIGSNRDR